MGRGCGEEEGKEMIVHMIYDGEIENSIVFKYDYLILAWQPGGSFLLLVLF